MARTKGTYSLSANIETLASAPLDARERVTTKADLTAVGSFPYFYEGMQVYVVSEKKRYTLKGNDPTVLASWEAEGTNLNVKVYKPSGSILFENLPVLSEDVLGNVYDVIDAFTTTSDFIEGVGVDYPAHTNVSVNVTGTAQNPVYKFDTALGNIDLSGYQEKMQYVTLPLPTDDLEGVIVQFIGTTTLNYTNGYFYKCIEDAENPGTYIWQPVSVQEGGSGGDSEITENITANIEVGGIASGTLIPEGTTLTEFAKKMLVKETAPTTTFTASGSGVKEIGTSVTPTLTLTITGTGTGTPTAIKFYNGSTLLETQPYVSGTNTYTHTMASAVTATTTVKGVLEYTKSDGTTTGTVEKSATYTFVMASYYGAVTTAPTTKAEIIALTKNVKNTKAQTATFNLSNQRSCYCYPASFGNLTSIKDANNFEYLSSYTKTTVSVDSVDYNVYTLTDPVTATGFKQVYA